MEKLKLRLDASATKHSKCSLDLYRTLVQGYRPKINSQEIEFGQAFHLGTKIYEETIDIVKACHAASLYYRDKQMSRDSGKKYLVTDYLIYLLVEWERTFFKEDSFTTLRDHNNKPLVEMKFEFLFYETASVEIWLAGTMDKIGEHNSSKLLAIGDYKTTSNAFVDSFLEDYVVDGQLYFYSFALRKHIDNCSPESILFKYRGKQIGAYIDGIFLRPYNKYEFKRSEIFIHSDDKISLYERMLENLCEKIDEMVRWSRINISPFKEGILNGSCKFCNFKVPCSSIDDDVEQHFLSKLFIQKTYDPLKFQE